MAEVLAVGASLSGQASSISPMSSTQSALRASVERATPVSARTFTPMRRAGPSRPIVSAVSPEFEIGSKRSRLRMRPRSPCCASVGCRKIEGVPVLAKVAEIFSPTRPALPTPVSTTCPSQASTSSTARRKSGPRRVSRCAIVRASRRSTSAALARRSFDRSRLPPTLARSTFIGPVRAPAPSAGVGFYAARETPINGGSRAASARMAPSSRSGRARPPSDAPLPPTAIVVAPERRSARAGAAGLRAPDVLGARPARHRTRPGVARALPGSPRGGSRLGRLEVRGSDRQGSGPDHAESAPAHRSLHDDPVAGVPAHEQQRPAVLRRRQARAGELPPPAASLARHVPGGDRGPALELRPGRVFLDRLALLREDRLVQRRGRVHRRAPGRPLAPGPGQRRVLEPAPDGVQPRSDPAARRLARDGLPAAAGHARALPCDRAIRHVARLRAALLQSALQSLRVLDAPQPLGRDDFHADARRPLVSSPFTIRLERVFQGPMDLLLHLVREQEVEIHEIEINTVVQGYLEYLKAMKDLDIELAGDFLVMAATLMSIKSRSLLPREEIDLEKELDPRDELIQRLIEYRRFKEAS